MMRTAAILMLAAALTCAGAPSWAQVEAGSDKGLGLTGGDIPPLLKDIEADPYKAPATPACATIPDEIAAIDKLLGPDVDTEAKVRGATGGDVVRGLLPYGGVFRFMTGANKKDRALRQAVLAGYARRGFLRGLESGLKCASAPAAAAPSGTPGR